MPQLDQPGLQQTLAAYVQHEILEVPGDQKLALVLGQNHELEGILERKGFRVARAPGGADTGYDLVVAADPGSLDVLDRVAPLGRVIVVGSRPSHDHERRLRAGGFLVRLRELDPCGEPCLYDAQLVTRRQSRR